MATYSNIYIDQGSTYSSVIDVKDSNGLPFNLTGYESRGQIRKSYSSANTTVFATNINLPLEGKVAVSLTAGQTRAMKAGRYIYDIEIFNDGGHVVRIAEGQVEINPGIANDDAVVLPPTPTLIEIIDDRIDERIGNQTITPSFANITGKPTTLSGYGITDAASSQAFRQSLGDSGDGNGYDTLQLHPDTSLSSYDQYLVIDPTSPGHIHIRAGGTQDASSAELYLGAEKNYVRVIDGQGVRIQNENADLNFYSFVAPTGYTSGTWYTSNGNHFLQLTSTDSAFIGRLEVFTDGAPNFIQFWSAGQPPANLTYVPGTYSQVGDVFTFQVNEGHGLGETQVAEEIAFGVYTPRINSIRLNDNDISVYATADVRIEGGDDVRIYAGDTFLLANYDVNEPVTIATNYDSAQPNIWNFNADGTTEFPSSVKIKANPQTQAYTFNAETEDGGPFVYVTIAGNETILDVDTTWTARIEGVTYGIISVLTSGSLREIRLEWGDVVYGNNVTFIPPANNWTFDKSGETTFPGDIFSTAPAGLGIIAVTGAPDVVIDAADTYGDPIVWRLFVLKEDYPTLGTDIKVGTTVTMNWGAQVTAAIISIIEDTDAGTWKFYFDQDIVSGYADGPKTATFGTENKEWLFGSDGNTIFPTLTTPRGDIAQGSLVSNTLKLGDGINQAVISTPDGRQSYSNSQRLVINPGQGNGFGEGGDIYLWAGRGGADGGSGGDIKIRGGYGPETGGGGYVRIEGGDTTNGSAGFVEIKGGYSDTTAGGDVDIYGGYGDGGTQNGNVTVNTYDATGVLKTWAFNTTGSTGTLTFPNSTVQSTAYQTGQITVLLNASTQSDAAQFTLESLAGANVMVFAQEEGYSNSVEHTVNIPAPSHTGQKLSLLNVNSDNTVAVNWPNGTIIVLSYNSVDLTAFNIPGTGLTWWVTNIYAD